MIIQRHWLPLVLLCVAPSAVAMHKCVDAEGNVTYSQTACGEVRGRSLPDAPPAGVLGSRPGGDALVSAPVDSLCERVRAYALELAVAMEQGVQLEQAVAILGSGRAATRPASRLPYSQDRNPGTRAVIGDDALEIIDYVFAFGGRGDIDPARIADLAAQRCRSGRFDLERGAPGGAEGLRRAAGDGVLLNPQGMLLTADRLISDCRSLRVFLDRTWRDAAVLRRDPNLGVSVLLASGLRGRPAVFADAPIAPGEPVFAASLPLRGVLTGTVSVAEGNIAPATATSAAQLIDADPTNTGADALPLSLPPTAAPAGAPLLNSGGLVAGISLGAPDGTSATPSALTTAALREFLQAANIAHFEAAALGPLTPQELRRRAAGFTVHVECAP